MRDLAVLIPARNEVFLARTVADVVRQARGDTEVIAVLDGAWVDPPVADHPCVRVIHHATPIGQRAATNLAARLAAARYVMKLDAHCTVAEGFDVELVRAGDEMGRDVTQIPRMYNLHAFDWVCEHCGARKYQGPTPTRCWVESCAETSVALLRSPAFRRDLVWQPRWRRRTDFARFDHELHFQYWSGYQERPEAQGDIADVMSSIGACFVIARDRFFELGGLDEAHGSWGQFGTEVACKSWLSGGRQVVNKRTWFAHLFRTQGGDFGFPYHNPQSIVEQARRHSRDLWLGGRWPGAVRPLSWLIGKFAPVPDWDEQAIARIGAATSPGAPAASTGPAPSDGSNEPSASPARPLGTTAAAVEAGAGARTASKGLAYYSDNRGDQVILSTVRQQILRASDGYAVVSATLGRVDFGMNMVPRQCGCGFIAWRAKRLRVCPKCGAEDSPGDSVFRTLERGHLTMFRQQLAALEALDTDVAFMVEHDVLYHPSHFDFTPPRDDTFYYNQHTWRVDAVTGRALFYYCKQVSGLCAARALLAEHYRKRVAHVETHGFDRSLGFEPGSNKRALALDDHSVETWMSAHPNVDIKTEFCLTPGRWNQDQFRNKRTCQGWTEADGVPGWGMTRGRFNAFLVDTERG